MRKTRSQFKRALRQCKSDSSRLTADVLAKSLLHKDDKSFWKEIKKCNNTNTPLASTINNAAGGKDIVNMWKEHFSNILNSSKDSSSKEFVENTLRDRNLYFERFTVSEVIEAIKSMKNGKSCGVDNIYSEHFKYACDKVPVVLTILFNTMVIHGHIPMSLLDTVLTPILKDKKGNVSDVDNYRPIAVTCVVSKVFELLILERYKDLFTTTSNQFGFKEKLGTDICVFTLKQVIEYYQSLSSPVYVAFLDASKAFDKINHYHLLYKLLGRNIPVIIVRLLYVWYKTQKFMVRWGAFMSDSFAVSNGVRQGGILSPVLFNIYLDDLSVKLNNSVGCSINGCTINHLFYADDSILMAPSPSGLQKLIDICVSYASQYELCFNAKKTKVMCFKPKSMSDLYVPVFNLGDKILDVVQRQKYLGVILEERLFDVRSPKRP